MSSPQTKSPKYHHGNLREALVNASVHMVREHGIEGLSLRKLADVVGVSRTAPYHHFKDKESLLAAVAQQGFADLTVLLTKVVHDTDQTLLSRLEGAVNGYLNFAITYPTQYDLMFGQSLWRTDKHAEFQRYAKDCFRQYVTLFEFYEQQGVLPKGEIPLRLAQLMWSLLHGLAKLSSDGIFAKESDLQDITAYAVEKFQRSLHTSVEQSP